MEPAVAPTFVDSLTPLISQIVTVLITGFIGWATVRFNGWVGMQTEARHREALQSAAMTGVNLQLAKGYAMGDRQRIIDGAAAWVEKSVPDAVAYFNLAATPDKLESVIESKIPVAKAIAASPPMAVQTSQTTTRPL